MEPQRAVDVDGRRQGLREVLAGEHEQREDVPGSLRGHPRPKVIRSFSNKYTQNKIQITKHQPRGRRGGEQTHTHMMMMMMMMMMRNVISSDAEVQSLLCRRRQTTTPSQTTTAPTRTCNIYTRRRRRNRLIFLKYTSLDVRSSPTTYSCGSGELKRTK